MFKISVIVGFGYVFLTISGLFELNPKKQYYNKLLQNKHFFANLLISILVAIFGYWRISVDKREVLYFMPFFYLLTLRLINWISIILKGRNIIIATHWDNTKGLRVTWIDRILSILIIMIPFLACGLILNNI